MTPIGTHILVAPETNPTSIGGIHLPSTTSDNAKARTIKGVILAIGAEVKLKALKVGATVYCHRIDSSTIRDGDHEVWLVSQSGVLAVD